MDGKALLMIVQQKVSGVVIRESNQDLRDADFPFCHGNFLGDTLSALIYVTGLL